VKGEDDAASNAYKKGNGKRVQKSSDKNNNNNKNNNIKKRKKKKSNGAKTKDEEAYGFWRRASEKSRAVCQHFLDTLSLHTQDLRASAGSGDLEKLAEQWCQAHGDDRMDEFMRLVGSLLPMLQQGKFADNGQLIVSNILPLLEVSQEVSSASQIATFNLQSLQSSFIKKIADNVRGKRIDDANAKYPGDRTYASVLKGQRVKLRDCSWIQVETADESSGNDGGCNIVRYLPTIPKEKTLLEKLTPVLFACREDVPSISSYYVGLMMLGMLMRMRLADE